MVIYQLESLLPKILVMLLVAGPDSMISTLEVVLTLLLGFQ